MKTSSLKGEISTKMIAQIVLVIIFIITLSYYIWPNKRAIRMLKNIKGLPTLPIIGNMHQIGFDGVDIFNNLNKIWAQTGHGTFKLFLGLDICVFVTEPDTVESILSSSSEIVKSDDYQFFNNWLGNGLVISTGSSWRKNRKTLTPAFHFKVLERFIHIFNRNSMDIIDIFSKNINKPIDVYKSFSLLALDMIVESTLGTKINSLKCSDSDNSNMDSEYAKAVYRICEIMHLRSYTFMNRISFLYKLTSNYKDELKCVEVLNPFGNKIIQERKLALKERIGRTKFINSDSGFYDFEDNEFEQKEKLSFLDLLLLTKNEDGTPLDEKIIADEVNNIIFAGHDTTSSLLSFVLFMLSKNPEVQKKVFEEQYSIFGDDKMKNVTTRDCANMKYMEMVIKETLRILPAVPIIGRQLQNDLTLKDGIVLPAGITLMISLYALGNNPKYVKSPELFDPERFSLKNVKGRHPFSFTPFSAGPRNCIGQKFALLEAKVVLSKLIRNFEFYNQGIEDHTLQLCAEVSMKSRNGVLIKIKQR